MIRLKLAGRPVANKAAPGLVQTIPESTHHSMSRTLNERLDIRGGTMRDGRLVATRTCGFDADMKLFRTVRTVRSQTSATDTSASADQIPSQIKNGGR